MRASLVLLVAFAACSDSSGPHQIPVLTTQLSTSADTVGGMLTVTLQASNPTDTTLHLSFTGSVLAEIKVAGQWQVGTNFLDGFGAGGLADTLSLAPGAAAQLGWVTVQFVDLSIIGTGVEYFPLSPGEYDVRGCYYPVGTEGVQGTIGTPACGNSVVLTVTQ